MAQELDIRFGEPEDIPTGGDSIYLSLCSMEVNVILGSRVLSPHKPRLTTQRRDEHGTQSLGSTNKGEVGTKMAMNFT